MTDDDIRVQYRDAKDKQKQIQILADMNLCTKQEMSDKLASLGLMGEEAANSAAKFVDKCAELYAEGLSDADIADLLGEPKGRVTSWRKGKGLTAHYPKHKDPKPKEEKKAPKPVPKPSQVSPNDPVNHPSHYTQGGIECIDALNAMVCSFTDPVEACLSWQVVKYIWRHPHKGKPVQDLEKARFYLNALIKHMEESK